VGQGLIDIEGGASGLNTWIEAAFRPDPTDRLAWRQRIGYRDPIAFLEGDLKVELMQRLLAAAWNGELTATRTEKSNGGTFESLDLQFAAEGSTVLRIPLEKMPFSNYLAPLPDAWLREITRRYSADTISVSEVLRELSRCIPLGFVERELPPPEHFKKHPLYFDFDEEIADGTAGRGAGNDERKKLQQLESRLAENSQETEKRRRQINEYVEFWNATIPSALNRSFGTLGFGTLREAAQELIEREPERAPKFKKN
jgi:hypothetical protein